MFDTLDLVQHVTGSTCNRGHTLDLVISKGLSVPTVEVKDLAQFFNGLVVHPTRYKTVEKIDVNEITSALFMEPTSVFPSLTAESVNNHLNTS